MTTVKLTRTGTKQLPNAEYVTQTVDQLYAPASADTSGAVSRSGVVVRATVTRESPDRIRVHFNMNNEQRAARIAAVNKRLRAR